ncbi:hypothetical protein KO481_27270 [Nocardia sp. NEAU-G5]|uniref:WXG100 family type VII secretion target n=1 Tax=Nocardia albiluteola TaxID=2842303 RepID=A0ABS6B777_9NOCA|nr:hypothetical protein [Nocardia albiluteola]MBU3065215.1 hypothetical protein [Nocardia albiluteola]
MADQIIVVPADVESAGRLLLDAQQRFDATVGRLFSDLASFGQETWGRDSYGTQFEQTSGTTPGYGSSKENLRDGSTQMSAALDGYSSGLIAAAGNATTNEADAATAF